jgi:hypothetical protein
LRPDQDIQGRHKPYSFSRLSAGEVQAGLDEFGLSVLEYCWITGTGPKTVKKWLDGEDEPPHQVAANFAMWRVPGALDAARAEADKKRIN